MLKILVRNLKLAPTADPADFSLLARKRLKSLVPSARIVKTSLFKRSVDARRRDAVVLLGSVLAETDLPDSEAERYRDRLPALDAVLWEEADPEADLHPGTELLPDRPVVVGFGPCGMFCALLLAKYGYRPLVIERGGSVAERQTAVRRFFTTGLLDPDTNIQFGAGGAGTFSDGKLMTRVNDPFCRYVLREFVRCGAPEDILVSAKPHIGTDILLRVVARLEERLRALGADILYHTRLEDIVGQNGHIRSVQTSGGSLPCGALILCTGHSARDTFAMLRGRGVSLLPKPFSVGFRAEHPQAAIDEAMYGKFAGLPALGHGEYQLSHRRADGLGVYTFCMCPGGEVVAAASEEGGVVVNGMSRRARDGHNANAAVAVSVTPEAAEAFGGGIAFQRMLERRAFEAGCTGRLPYAAPCQTMGDFLGLSVPSSPAVEPTYMGGNVVMTDLASLFPASLTEALRDGIRHMDRQLGQPGVFASPGALLTGVETRTSSPIRIPRLDSLSSPDFDNLYPCGEGAGYAGGITSAALDGLRCAMTLIRRYRPLTE